jgi:hypothetical protein
VCCCLNPQGYTSATWNRTTILANNPLASAIVNNVTLKRAFYWTSHTFTHENLNNASLADTT